MDEYRVRRLRGFRPSVDSPYTGARQRGIAVGGITFAIPYYRGPDHLRRAIASVRAQSSDRWQLLICDDSPSGEARSMMDSADSRFQYLHDGGRFGMAGNWNRCLDRAETDLVTILHADDELLPNYAAQMLSGAVEHPEAAALFCPARVIDEQGRTTFSFADTFKWVLAPAGRTPKKLHGPRSIAKLLRVNSIMCPTVCYRRSRIGSHRFDPRWRCALDLEFFVRLLADGEEFVGLPEVAYAYRRHDSNATAKYTESLLKFEEEADLYDEIATAALRRGWVEVARVARAKTILRGHVLFRIARDLMRGRGSAARAKARFFAQRLFVSNPGPAPCGI